MSTPAFRADHLVKRFPGVPHGAALDGVCLDVALGQLTAIVGPDGAGKTTLLRLLAGLMRADAGQLEVLGIDVARDPQAVQERISYMPQKFGLYEDLSVRENLELYADLHGVSQAARQERFTRMLAMTDLQAFTERPAGKLSGGMKQKLGLACTLVRTPDLLLLDEPTVGVDPLSRRELWRIIQQLIAEEGISVVFSSAYLDEAEASEQVIVMHEGQVLAQGSPEALRQDAAGRCFLCLSSDGLPARALQARLLDAREEVVDAVPSQGAVRFMLTRGHTLASLQTALAPRTPQDCQATPARLEDAVMALLRAREHATQSVAPTALPPEAPHRAPEPTSHGWRERLLAVLRADARPFSGQHTHRQMPTGAGRAPGQDAQPPTARPATLIQVRELVRRFGDFTAVARTSFEVRRGEIFGLLGPNGAGKTTTFRMLCGLLPASSGFLEVAGFNLRTARAAARARIGYVSQKFSLYGNLSVRENLSFFGGAYGLHGHRLQARIQTVLEAFELGAHGDARSGELPGGYKQRLAMATALLHEPEILFLDEPTSGIDPLARRAFWRRITALADTGTTIIVTTHFMEEAEYCDRIVIQDAGQVLALGTPDAVRARVPDARDMNAAFIGIVEQARHAHATTEAA